MSLPYLIFTVLKKWESDKLSLVIIEGSGEKAFCAGGDIRAITSASDRGSVSQAEFFAEEYKLNNLVQCFEMGCCWMKQF
jgi:enoyl-CoA hydratase/carnithine racemase